jgi:hypothetical protein
MQQARLAARGYSKVNIQNKEEEKKTPGPATVRQ